MDLKPIKCPLIKLNITNIDVAAKFTGAVYNKGIWWRELYKGFWWPFDIQEEFTVGPKPPFLKAFLGYQHLAKETEANCYLRFMVIKNLQDWGPDKLQKKQRSVIRKAFENLEIRKIDKFNKKQAEQAMFSWNNLVERTSWRKKMTQKTFFNYWNKLFDTPGLTLIGAYKNELLVGWLIGILYDNGHCYPSRYVSHRDYFDLLANNALIYCFLLSAQTSGAKTANFGLFLPDKPGLDRFKEHLGFKRKNFPAYIYLNTLAKLAIKILKPKELNRITGWGRA
ncbi:hypothetical protein AMJ49_04975 [Parcubacteria bacterium DG_74_2]|nr:MAG: hypothetical protein AMJ49_04975 [Parcubacteria bacterium DG_74_2]